MPDDLLHDMQLTESLFAKTLPADKQAEAVRFLIQICSNSEIKKAVDAAIDDHNSSDFQHLERLVYFTRHLDFFTDILNNAENALAQLQQKPLEEEEKIYFEEYLVIHDVAKSLKTLQRLPFDIIQTYPELHTLYKQSERAHDFISSCEKFTLASKAPLTMYMPVEPLKPTVADWLVALQANLVRMTPLPGKRFDLSHG